MNKRSVLAQAEACFGAGWWMPPVYYSHEFSLRIELAQGEFWVERLVSAQLRASAITSAALSGSRETHLVVAHALRASAMETEELVELSAALLAYGLPRFAACESQVVPPTDAEDLHTWLGIARLPRSQINRAIVAALASDLEYFPGVPGHLFILDLEHGVLVHPYDDRGMDVASTSRNQIQNLYDVYGHWLLDYDRQRMDEAFG